MDREKIPGWSDNFNEIEQYLDSVDSLTRDLEGALSQLQMRSEQAKRYRKDVRNLREILFKDTWKGTRKRAYAVSVFDYDRSTGFQDDVLSGISGAIKLRKGIEEQLGETEAQNYFQLTENYDELLD